MVSVITHLPTDKMVGEQTRISSDDLKTSRVEPSRVDDDGRQQVNWIESN